MPAYIDLKLWGFANIVKFTNPQLVKALFPIAYANAAVSDDRTRRTVGDKAEELLSEETLNTLIAQSPREVAFLPSE